MKKAINLILILALTFFINCSEDTATFVGEGTVTGRVVEANSFNPIENAKISLSPTNNTVFTDIDGYFKMENVEEGDYSVSATKEDYLTSFEAATVTKGIEVNVIFELEDDNSLNRSPSKPTLLLPIDGAENTELSVELTWESVDPEKDSLIFRLEIKNDLNNTIIKVDSIMEMKYVLSDLKYGVKYFWQIAASDQINDEVLSAVNTFKTKSNPDNRYFYVKKGSNNNSIIFSSSFNSTDLIGENEVQLTTEDLNSWRPRKNQAANLVAFLRTFNNQTHLFTMNQDGSDIKQITSDVSVNGFNYNEIDYSWSSNGDRFIYPHYDKLYVINKDGSGLKEIYKTADGSYITECDWSSDESTIALKTNDISGYNISIFTINMSGTILKTILSDVSGAAGGLNISVDNKLLLYCYDISGYENLNNRQLDTHVFITNLVTDITSDLSFDKVPGTIDIDPRFSPNEAQIIFVNTSNDGISTKNIYKMDLDINNNDNNNNRTEMFLNATMPDWE